MKVRTQPNYLPNEDKDVFGVSIMPDNSRYYCKYPIGHQRYESKVLAEKAADEIREILNNGGTIEYSPNGSQGKNKNEYVKICSNNK